MRINKRLKQMDEENIFEQVSIRVNNFKKEKPSANVISLGVGDVSKPVIETVAKAMKNAVDDLTDIKTFKGYGSFYGYDFLKEAILENEYKDQNFSLDEVYISSGAKTDTTSILELFDEESKILITDVMYPIYKDGAAALSRDVEIMKVYEEDKFVAKVPKEKYDIIYICSPNNPIGIAYTKDELKAWVDYAIANDAVILYDNVYSSFVKSPNVAKSIYEIKGARSVAIEFRSFSKHASFTGVRCSYYLIPKEIKEDINYYWKKRTINRFNGADYIAQKGAEASFSKESQEELAKNVDAYLKGAKTLKEAFQRNGFKVWGGEDSPFLWIKTKDKQGSWDFFDKFLKELNIIIIPGRIFGEGGDGYFRVSALAPEEVINEAINRIDTYYKN